MTPTLSHDAYLPNDLMIRGGRRGVGHMGAQEHRGHGAQDAGGQAESAGSGAMDNLIEKIEEAQEEEAAQEE